MKEFVIVKKMRDNKMQSSIFFDNYIQALNFSEQECQKGFYCIVLRKYGEKKWSKVTFIPQESL